VRLFSEQRSADGDQRESTGIFVEEWAANYGSPYLVAPDDSDSVTGILVEDDNSLRVHAARPEGRPHEPIAFVDGVRRGEACLYQYAKATGSIARGVAGGHACGAVIVRYGDRAEFGETRVRRLIIWGSGLMGDLPPVRGGWSWRSVSIADPSPDAPLRELQTRMRQEEGRLAEALCEKQYLVLIDGPLNFLRSRDLPVVGYVKTHHRALLASEHHARIPQLCAGERTSLFRLGEDRYSCYLRLTAPGQTTGPWSGIVRLEIPQSAGFMAAKNVVNRVAALIPRFAGIPHRDMRAPQNLQPIGALEHHLRHLLGNAGLATRAVRESVAHLMTKGV
jgi:hypothetical protein